MNLAYWEEQIKATVASVAHLAVPVELGGGRVYLPIVLRERLLTGESCLGHRVQD
jgi:hypothetical protein